MADREAAAERFKRLAEARVNKTIKDVRLIANLSNKNNYAYTPADIDKIFKALDRELKAARAKFDGVKGEDDTRFRL
jgi:hypothetical protein